MILDLSRPTVTEWTDFLHNRGISVKEDLDMSVCDTMIEVTNKKDHVADSGDVKKTLQPTDLG